MTLSNNSYLVKIILTKSNDFTAVYNDEPTSLKVECIPDSTVIKFNAQKF